MSFYLGVYLFRLDLWVIYQKLFSNKFSLPKVSMLVTRLRVSSKGVFKKILGRESALDRLWRMTFWQRRCRRPIETHIHDYFSLVFFVRVVFKRLKLDPWFFDLCKKRNLWNPRALLINAFIFKNKNI